MVRRSRVPRPTRSTEYTLIFGTRQAERGLRDLVATQRNAVVETWEYLTRTPQERGLRDLVATQRNAVVETWEYLTRTPQERVPRNHRLKGELSTVTHDGRTHEQWQHELTNGARIWFYVDESTVVLVDVHTRHPNQTK